MDNFNYQQFIEQSPIMIHSVLPNGEIEYVSDRWLEVLEFSRKDVIGKRSVDFLSESNRQKALLKIQKIKENHPIQNEEFEFVTKSKKIIVTLISASAIYDDSGELLRIVAYLADITNEKKLMQQSQLESVKLKMALKVSSLGVWSWDFNTGKLEWDDVMHEIFGVDKKKFHGTFEDWIECLHPEDRDPTLLKLDWFRKKRKSFEFGYRIIRNDNQEIRHIKAIGNAIYDKDGKPSLLLGINYDVTNDRKREEELRSTNNRLQVALKSSDFGVWDWDYTNQNFYWDEGMCKIYGVSPQNTPKSIDEWKKFIPKEFVKRAELDIEMAVKTKGMFDSEFPIIKSDGSKRYIRGLGKTVLDSDGNSIGLVGLNSDITEQKNAQLALAQAQKFAALGEMAGEVAHEINNPLTIIDGFVEKAKRQLSKPDVNLDHLLSDLNKISETIKRIANIVSGMKKYVRDSSLDDAANYKVSSIVSEVTHLMSEKFRSSGIEIIVAATSQCKIKCRPVEISQALINLLNNSFDAIKNLPKKWVKIECSNANGEIIIAVVDSGPGIPLEIRDKILNRFYTTKEYGEGSGMGLNITKGLIESYGGRLELDENSANTRFQMIFPNAKE